MFRFFITNSSQKVINSSSLEMSEIWNLKVFHDKNLKLEYYSSKSKNVLILGNVFSLDGKEESLGPRLLACESITDIIRLYDNLGGKFVIYYRSEDFCVCLSDVFNIKNLFYCFDNAGFYLGSSDKIISEFLDLEIQLNPNKINLLDKDRFRLIEENWIIDDSEWDDRFKILISNHYLDINNKKAERMPFLSENLNLEQFKEYFIFSTIEYLKQISKIGEINLALTAGYDSRLILACLSKLGILFNSHTFKRGGQRNLIDVKIAQKLMAGLPNEHRVIVAEELASDFKINYRDFFIVNRDLPKTKNFQWFKNKTHKNFINVTGDGGAVFRSWLEEKDFKNSQSINKKYNWYGLKESKEYIEKWFNEAHIYSSNHQIKISDLFYLEVRLGKWGALGFREMEYSGVLEFTPFANRGLIMSYLSNKEALTISENGNNLFRDIIRDLNSELDKISYNPKIWKDYVKIILKRIGALD